MKMRMLFVADGRSPIARGWIEPLIERGHEVHLASTFQADALPGLKSFHVVNVAFSGLGRRGAGAIKPPGGASVIGLRSFIRHWLGPLTLVPAGRRLQAVVDQLDVDLVHALRIPFEGMLAARSDSDLPLVLSIWGNDFTLHAQSSPFMRAMTRAAVRSADGVHADCRRDIRLALDWGLQPEAPTTVLPGGGGVDRTIFHPGDPLKLPVRPSIQSLLRSIPQGDPVVINPRGFRAYVRNDTFFSSLARVLEAHPGTHFLMPAMAGEVQVRGWLGEEGVRERAHLLPRLNAAEMAALYRRAWILVSPSEHDGTPNTFLEAIACGCFPIVGDLESLREWIEPGMNGELIDAGDAEQLASAIIRAIGDPHRRKSASAINQTLIDEHAARTLVSSSAETFYRAVVERRV